MDRGRKGKKASNAHWESPADRDSRGLPRWRTGARIRPPKLGAADLESEAILPHDRLELGRAFFAVALTFSRLKPVKADRRLAGDWRISCIGQLRQVSGYASED
jgi:hypothetical protein